MRPTALQLIKMVSFDMKIIRRLCLLSALMLTACSSKDGPFLMVETCVFSDAGVSKFVNEMEHISKEHKMHFIDRSAESGREVAALNYSGVERSRGGRVVNVSAVGSDGLSFGATNLGLPHYQIVVGFSEGSDPSKAREFAGEAIRRFQQHWMMKRVPSGAGGRPMSNCH